MTIPITYALAFENGTNEEFRLAFDDETMLLAATDDAVAAEWARLGFHQCPNCPLLPRDTPYCPAALHLEDLVRRLGKVVSYEKVAVRVVTNEREIHQNTTAQTVFSSLMGLLIASSGCPHAAYFRPMARFHLPLASYEETIFRAASTYLMAQYFRHHLGEPFDVALKGLVTIYDDIQTVNASLAQRLRNSGEITETNAIAHLDLYAQALPVAIEEALGEFRDLFGAYTSPTVGQT